MNATRFLTLAIASVLAAITASAASVNLKMGKPTKEELAMTKYDADPSAAAVVLAKWCDAKYNYNGTDGLTIIYEYNKRIKILTDAGTGAATMRIRYKDDGSKLMFGNDKVEGLQVTTYNVENGKTVKTKMDKDEAQVSKDSANNCTLTFTAPAVKAGSIVEVKYRVNSSRIIEIRPWVQQERIPVLYTKLNQTLIDYFLFGASIVGSLPVDVNKTQGTVNFTVQDKYKSHAVLAGTVTVTYTTQAMPAVKEGELANAVVFAFKEENLPWVDRRTEQAERSTTTWNDVSQNVVPLDFQQNVSRKIEACKK